MRKVVVLPQPDGPSRVDELAVLDREVDAVDRLDLGEVPADLVQGDAGHRSYLKICLANSSMAFWRSGTVVPSRLGRQQGPRISSHGLLDHAFHDRVVAGVGVDDLLLGLEIVVHEQARGVGARRVLQHARGRSGRTGAPRRARSA